MSPADSRPEAAPWALPDWVPLLVAGMALPMFIFGTSIHRAGDGCACLSSGCLRIIGHGFLAQGLVGLAGLLLAGTSKPGELQRCAAVIGLLNALALLLALACLSSAS